MHTKFCAIYSSIPYFNGVTFYCRLVVSLSIKSTWFIRYIIRFVFVPEITKLSQCPPVLDFVENIIRRTCWCTMADIAPVINQKNVKNFQAACSVYLVCSLENVSWDNVSCNMPFGLSGKNSRNFLFSHENSFFFLRNPAFMNCY